MDHKAKNRKVFEIAADIVEEVYQQTKVKVEGSVEPGEYLWTMGFTWHQNRHTHTIRQAAWESELEGVWPDAAIKAISRQIIERIQGEPEK